LLHLDRDDIEPGAGHGVGLGIGEQPAAAVFVQPQSPLEAQVRCRVIGLGTHGNRQAPQLALFAIDQPLHRGAQHAVAEDVAVVPVAAEVAPVAGSQRLQDGAGLLAWRRLHAPGDEVEAVAVFQPVQGAARQAERRLAAQRRDRQVGQHHAPRAQHFKEVALNQRGAVLLDRHAQRLAVQRHQRQQPAHAATAHGVLVDDHIRRQKGKARGPFAALSQPALHRRQHIGGRAEDDRAHHRGTRAAAGHHAAGLPAGPHRREHRAVAAARHQSLEQPLLGATGHEHAATAFECGDGRSGLRRRHRGREFEVLAAGAMAREVAVHPVGAGGRVAA
jgi:hypothetical protein